MIYNYNINKELCIYNLYVEIEEKLRCGDRRKWKHALN